MLHNEVASSEKAGPDWVKHACRRMKHFAALPQNMKHRRCGMKQSLFRLHIFCLESRQKKWRLENFIATHHSEPHFGAETSEFRCEMKF